MSQFIDTIVCDEMRREDNGKLLAIGIYSEGYAAADLTKPVPLTLWLRMFGVPEGSHNSSIVVKFDGVLQHRIAGSIDVDSSGKVQIFIQSLPLKFGGPGLLEFFHEFEDGETIYAGNIPVISSQ